MTARRDVYCYFDNDQKVNAPFDARRMRERPAPVPLRPGAAAPVRAAH